MGGYLSKRDYAPSYELQVYIDGINGSAELRQVLTCDKMLWRVTPSKVQTNLYADYLFLHRTLTYLLHSDTLTLSPSAIGPV